MIPIAKHGRLIHRDEIVCRIIMLIEFRIVETVRSVRN